MQHDEVPVLIVGGSLVGLSLSLFLAQHGVAHLVVERHPGTAIHPRAAFLMQRTVELYRGVGIEKEVLAAAQREFVQNGAIMAVESLGGKELQYFFRNINDGVEQLSASPRIFVTQIGLEPVLRDRAAALGARMRYSAEVVSLLDGDDGVVAVVRDRGTGEETTVRARYAVAADGAHSPVRRQFGIDMLGHGTFSDSITIYFKADVRPLLGERNLSVVYVVSPRLQGFFRFSLDGRSGFLVVNSALDEAGQRTTTIGATATDESCIRYVREALGAPDIDVEIEDVQRWSASAQWARRLRSGHVLLAGDAAHVMPPTGGYGGNTGVHDAHNLAWKLAYVLDGRAGNRLLDTYEAERLPVARMTVEQAYTRYVTRLDPGLGTDNLEPLIDDPPIDLGYRYSSDSFSVADEEYDDRLWEDPKEPSGRPGFRAPHIPLRRNGSEVSTLDLIGTDPVLFTLDGDVADLDGVDVYRIGVDVDDPAGGFAKAYGVNGGGAVLVRPDGFIAWRGNNSAGEVRSALARMLCQDRSS